MVDLEAGRRARAPRPVVPQAAPGLRIVRHHDEISAAIARVVASGRYVLGAECEAFEKEFARFLDVPFAIGVNSGTDALSLALLAVGVGPGQEVIVPALTAAATAVAVRRIGAAIRFVDVEPGARGISPAELTSAISSRTAAVIVVHLHGIPALLPEIRNITAAHKIAVVEDCAHAHGATINGRRVGTTSDAAAFSFYPTKNLGALGDGGAVIVHTQNQAELVRRLRNYGQDSGGICVQEGMNSRLDEIQAAVLRVLLRHLREENLQRRMHAQYYDNSLSPLADRGRIRLPRQDPGAVYHQYAIEIADRDRVRAGLLTHRIETAIHYPLGLHRHPGFSRSRVNADCPVADRLASTLLSLPIQPEIMEHRHRITEALISTIAAGPEGASL